MNVLPAPSNENEENKPPSPPQRGRGLYLARKGSSRVLGRSRHHLHANSKSPRKERHRSDGSGCKHQLAEQGNGRHIRWEDESGVIRSESSDRNLEERGIVGVYVHEECDGTNQVFRHDDDHGFVPSQRVGLQRRFMTDSSRDSGSFDSIDGLGTTSPERTACRRIMSSRSSIRIKYSSTAKRRMMVMGLAVGLVLLGYFVEVRQIMHASYQREGNRKDWLINLPSSFSATILGGNTNDDARMARGDFSNARMVKFSRGNRPIASMEEEWKRVRNLSKDRAESRRRRTHPPSFYPSSPADFSSSPPRLILDLPIHRDLENSLVDHRAMQEFPGENINNSLRRRLSQKTNNPQKPQQAICGPEAREAAQLNPNHYPRHARVGPKSRIVITGALTQVGMELILQLYEQCNVQFIMGIDSAYPNTRHERIDLIESRYQYVQRRVPGFQRLVVPVFGIHPHPKVGEEVQFESANNGFDLVRRFNPTHIVHLACMEEGGSEHADYGDTAGASPFVDGGKRSMMRRFDNLLSTDQVLLSLAEFNKSRPGEPQPQLVYASSNEANDRSGVSLKSGVASRQASVYGTTSLLKEVLASYYHRNHGVYSVGLRVPSVFGPFSRPGSLLHDLAERTVRAAAGDDVQGVPKHHLDRDRYELSILWKKREGAAQGVAEQVAYVYDVASAIVAAMQLRRDYGGGPSIDLDGPTLMRIGSRLVVSSKELKERMEGHLPPAEDRGDAATAVATRGSSYLGEIQEWNSAIVLHSPGISIFDAERNRDLIGWAHKTTLDEGARSALAWQVLKAYPFGLPASVQSRPIFQNLLESSKNSLTYHRLPCASGCSWGGTMCSSSPWDGIIETAREITETCPYVLYTVDLRPELDNLEKQSAPSQRKGWEDWFCKIAFVSVSSKLAERHYITELASKAPINQWNGKNKVGQWIVVVLEGSQYTMKEYERSLAKLTPSNLFNEKVDKAMYVNHRRVILTTDQAMGVMRHLEMFARKSPEKKTIVDEKTKENVDIYLPPQPHRHSILFTNRYSFADGYDMSSAKNLASFVMTNAGIPETRDIRAQMQFYEQAGHLTRTNMQRSPNYQEFFQDNLFPYDFLRSTWVVHELRSEEGRILRCEMYEEHSLWGNADMEDMSMGFVLAKRKVRMQLGKVADHQYSGPEEWYPLLVPRKPGAEGAIAEGPVYLDYLDAAQKVATDNKGHEFYITFLPQKRKE